jgi:hypothetical protein
LQCGSGRGDVAETLDDQAETQLHECNQGVLIG